MRIKLHIFILFIFIFIIIEKALSKGSNNTKITVTNHKKHSNLNHKSNNGRNKRSLDDEEPPFWANRGRRFVLAKNENGVWENSKKGSSGGNLDDDGTEKQPPFWANRGRRDNSPTELFFKNNFPLLADNKFGSNCKHCFKTLLRDDLVEDMSTKERREEESMPFWGSRGKRNFDKNDDEDIPFWGSRGRRQEEEPPFWGSRGRRDEEIPFWGSRGRRYSLGSRLNDDTEEPPFWANRGRRDDSESSENYVKDKEPPFWGSRGRRYDSETSWDIRMNKNLDKYRRKENLKHFLREAINKVENNIENLIRSRRDNGPINTFWNNRGRNSQLKYLFQGSNHRFQPHAFLNNKNEKSLQPRTMLDDRIFAEQPHYIVVERSSRSSGEDDPFFISRGKKFINNDVSKATRDRRGAIEELVKSVRNDPYYIARGKKDTGVNQSRNSTLMNKELGKAKELICATIDLILMKDDSNKVKREVNDNERERRTILKKLAAQLQMDPYFVSRGKKNESGITEDNIQEFVNEVSTKCN